MLDYVRVMRRQGYQAEDIFIPPNTKPSDKVHCPVCNKGICSGSVARHLQSKYHLQRKVYDSAQSTHSLWYIYIFMKGGIDRSPEEEDEEEFPKGITLA